MPCLPNDREGALREVAQVYELIKNHPLLHHHQGRQLEPPATTEQAKSLLREALRALNIALSVMKQQQQESASTTHGATSTSARSSKRKRKSVIEGMNSSRVRVTTVPYEDGFVWRKYGEKKINGTHFTRSYYRCTYKDDKGCLATKYIQQKDKSDPPVFQVTYNSEHTCNCTTTSSPAKENNDSCNNLPTERAAASFPPIGHRDITAIKQQANIPLDGQIPCQEPIPLADVSTVPLDYQKRSQEPVPTADHYATAGDTYQHANIQPATRSSAGNGDSSFMSLDNLDMERIMTELLMGDDDHELQGLEQIFSRG